VESINPHVSREYKFGLKITDRCCVKVSRNNIFLQDYKHIKLLGLWKSEVLFMLIVRISLNYWRFFRYFNTVLSTRSVHISISCIIELVSIYLLFWWYASSVNICLEVEQYFVVIRSSLLQETFLRSYIFSRIHIQGKESSSSDLQSMCGS